MISLAGLSTPWLMGLGFAGLGVISLLYLLRLRRRQLVVPYLPLWHRVVQRKQYQSLFERLKRLISWLLQLFFWGLLLLALADPRLRAELLSGRNLVVVVDTSASMKAQEGSTTRFASAKEEALRQVGSLVGQDRMMLVAMDREVIPLTPFTTDKALLRRQLDDLKASDTSSDLRRALWLAEDALIGRKRGEILVISDGAFGSLHEDLLEPLPDQKKPLSSPVLEPKPRASVSPKDTTRPKDAPTPKDIEPKTATQKEPTQQRPPSPRKKASKKKKRTSKRKSAGKRKKKITTRKGRVRRGKKRVRRGKAAKGKGRKTIARQPPPRREIELPEGIERKLDLSAYTSEVEAARKLPPFRLVSIGKSADNVGIVALSARRQPEHPLHFAAYIEVQNFSKEPASGFLELYVNELIVESVQMQMSAGERLRKTFPKLLAQGQKLEARLVIKQGKDHFEADNRAYAVLPKTEPPSVLMVSDENLYLHAALLSDPQISYRNVTCAAYPTTQGRFDIVIFNRCAPPTLPREGRFLFFDPPEQGTPFEVVRDPEKMLKQPLVTEQRQSHPVMQFVTMSDINIARAVRLTKQPNDIVLVGAFTDPLILARKEKDRISMVIGFSLRETDLPLRVAFPLFVRNAIQWMMRGGRPEPPTTRVTGDLWDIDLPANVNQVRIEMPKEAGQPAVEIPVRDGQVTFAGKYAGFYRLSAPGFEQWLGANLADVQESTIQPRRMLAALEKKAEKKQKETLRTEFDIAGFRIPIPRPIWLFLLLLALVLLSIEWWTYNRRLTV